MVCPERAAPSKRQSRIDRHLNYLSRRWAEGCHNSAQLHREIRSQGYRGSESSVRHFVARWRASLPDGAVADFRWLLVSATLASVIGAFCIPTFQRLFARYVEAFARYRSVPRILTRVFSPSGSAQFRESIRVPAWKNISNAHRGAHIPWKVVLLNTVAMAIWTVGVFSALYAAYLHPELRVTSSQLSAVINGVATILMFMFIDPYLSLLTDEVVEGKVSDPYFRRSIVWLTGSRIAGTIMAQLLLIPAALWIVTVAEWL